MRTVADIGEFGLIARLRDLDIVQGIGDDCAIVQPLPGHDLVMTADALIENVHFRHDWISWHDLGFKAMAVNLSDIAAMGAAPLGVLVTLGLRAEATDADVLDFYAGAAEVLTPHGAAIVGGDIVASPKASAISVTAYGSMPHGTAARRGRAQMGDGIWVTGTLGDSAAGLRLLISGFKDFPALIVRHHRPQPRISAGQALVQSGILHAMMDVSDGLAGDLGHLCHESGVGATIDAAALPFSNDFERACEQYGWDRNELALRGGEDYELLFTLPSNVVPPNTGVRMTRVGVIDGTPGLRLRNASSFVQPLDARSFTHF